MIVLLVYCLHFCFFLANPKMLLKSSIHLPTPSVFPMLLYFSNLQILPLWGFYGLERKYYNTYSIFFPGEIGLQLPVEQITQLLGERTAESRITLDLLWASPVTLSKISTSFKQPLCPSHLDLKTWSYILKSCYAAFAGC